MISCAGHQLSEFQLGLGVGSLVTFLAVILVIGAAISLLKAGIR